MTPDATQVGRCPSDPRSHAPHEARKRSSASVSIASAAADLAMWLVIISAMALTWIILP